MQQLTTTATFTDGRFDDEALTTIVARSVLEAALAEDEKAQLWFEIGSEDDEARRIAVDLSASDLEEILRLSGDDDVSLTLSGNDLVGLFDDADVEAHGLRGAIAIAVASAAIIAPAGHAATTQAIGAETTAQRAGIAATTEVSTQATAQVTNAAARAQVATVQAKLARSQANLKALRILRHGLVR